MEAEVTCSSRTSKGVSSTSAYSHINRASAAKAIQYLDNYAFPSTLLSPSTSSSLKRKKVSEVIMMNNSVAESSQSVSQKSSMSGLSHLYRERARQRRKSRAALHESNASKKEQVKQLEQAATFQPFSLALLLERLATFSISTYSSKPEECRKLDPVNLAMQGWRHASGKERDVMTCLTCQAEWKASVEGIVDQKDRIAAWKQIDDSVPSKHLHWCPWRLRGCHPSLYRVPVQSRIETSTELIRTARTLAQCAGIEDLQVISSLSTSEEESLSQLTSEPVPLSCLLLSLLGWKLTEAPTLIKDSIVQCEMCSRRIGLWGFIRDQPNTRILDVMKEHKVYCPYINGMTQGGSSTTLNAWQQRLQILTGANHKGACLPLSQEDVRKMKSSEVLAKVKSMMM